MKKIILLSDRTIQHTARALRDTASTIMDRELDPDFDKLCNEIVAARKKRGFAMNDRAHFHNLLAPTEKGSVCMEVFGVIRSGHLNSCTQFFS